MWNAQRSSATTALSFLPSVSRTGRQRLPVESVAVEGFRAKIQIRGQKPFGLAQKKISTGFQVEMQALEYRESLDTREMRQDIHTENAVKTTDVAGTRKVHAVECDQAAKARLHQQVRANHRLRLTGKVGIELGVVGKRNRGHHGCADLRKIVANRCGRKALQRRLLVHPSIRGCNVARQQVATDDVNRASRTQLGSRLCSCA